MSPSRQFGCVTSMSRAKDLRTKWLGMPPGLSGRKTKIGHYLFVYFRIDIFIFAMCFLRTSLNVKTSNAGSQPFDQRVR